MQKKKNRRLGFAIFSQNRLNSSLVWTIDSVTILTVNAARVGRVVGFFVDVVGFHLGSIKRSLPTRVGVTPSGKAHFCLLGVCQVCSSSTSPMLIYTKSTRVVFLISYNRPGRANHLRGLLRRATRGFFFGFGGGAISSLSSGRLLSCANRSAFSCRAGLNAKSFRLA